MYALEVATAGESITLTGTLDLDRIHGHGRLSGHRPGVHRLR